MLNITHDTIQSQGLKDSPIAPSIQVICGKNQLKKEINTKIWAINKGGYAVKRKMSMLMSFFLLFLALGCAPEAKRKVIKPPPHSHYYPFTEVIGEYHLRLIVDHADGDMALVFEDFAERPVEPVTYDSLEGKVTFPGGTLQQQTFRARTSPGEKYRRRYYSRKYGSLPRQQGIFTARGDWIKTTPAFTLEVTVPFTGERHQLTFQYEAPGGKVPYHRR